MSPVIEVKELLKIYREPDVLIFDASNSKNAKANYDAEHLEGAFFIDLNTHLADIKSDVSNGGRHPLPRIDVFAGTLTGLGISKEKHIVIYDEKNGANAAARFWWMLKAAGHEKVQVLNGGLSQAKKENFPMSSKAEKMKIASEPYRADQWVLPTVDMNTVEAASQNPDYLVVDVRDKDRYDGKKEPIDLIAGHIPGAVNVPFAENLNKDGLFLNPNELRTRYAPVFGGLNTKNVIVHCGSGVTACHTLLALDYAEMGIPKLYVGSWSEWSRNNKKIGKTIG